jgi:hypothetical protein
MRRVQAALLGVGRLARTSSTRCPGCTAPTCISILSVEYSVMYSSESVGPAVPRMASVCHDQTFHNAASGLGPQWPYHCQKLGVSTCSCSCWTSSIRHVVLTSVKRHVQNALLFCTTGAFCTLPSAAAVCRCGHETGTSGACVWHGLHTDSRPGLASARLWQSCKRPHTHAPGSFLGLRRGTKAALSASATGAPKINPRASNPAHVQFGVKLIAAYPITLHKLFVHMFCHANPRACKLINTGMLCMSCRC